MKQKLRDIANEVAVEIYNQNHSTTAEAFLDRLEPIPENMIDLLPCFNNCSNLYEVFTIFDNQFKDSICETEIANSIMGFGEFHGHILHDTEISPIKPDWLVVRIKNEAFRYHRYFSSFRESIGCILQASLVDQMIQVFDWEDTDHDWRSVIERQLVISLAVVRWHELGGALTLCIDHLLETFRMEGLELIKPINEFMLHYLTHDKRNLLKEYCVLFHENPKPSHFNKAKQRQWLFDHLPE